MLKILSQHTIGLYLAKVVANMRWYILREEITPEMRRSILDSFCIYFHSFLQVVFAAGLKNINNI
jgi:hypothetical protein